MLDDELLPICKLIFFLPLQLEKGESHCEEIGVIATPYIFYRLQK